ncbi:hypothetical protein OPU71_06175 [Niveibacterium sp. 24ML]|uniref:hypothetical protein n=1 Tax=Niveibacterium sp. 24ML TaxID=2985512 RepID=UPI0022717353|nr:hypothetical protein [Niveibacterium sp. 24ML]MCX9155710.1 hypothetical protein [Niveibacterium sp. 24ML]
MKSPLIAPRAQLWIGRDAVSLCGADGSRQHAAFSDAASLRAACAALAQTQPRWRGIEGVLSDAHCRYLVLPRLAGTRGRAELQASIAARFGAAFGDDPADWLLQSDGALLGSTDLVCGLRQERAAAIRAGLADARRRLHSLQPLWVWCSQRPLGAARAPHWLASSDGDALTVGLFAHGSCVGVRSTRLGEDSLAACLDRETALQSAHAAGTPVWLFGDSAAPARLADGSPVVGAALPPAAARGGMA